MAKSIPVSLSDVIAQTLAEAANDAHMSPSDYAARLIEDHFIRVGAVAADHGADILLARSLVDRAAERALRLVESEGFRSSITYDTIEDLTKDPAWLDDYRKFIRDDPFKSGVARKLSINQNIGYFIKKALGAKSLFSASGKPVNVKVKGSIIQSYTPLEQ